MAQGQLQSLTKCSSPCAELLLLYYNSSEVYFRLFWGCIFWFFFLFYFVCHFSWSCIFKFFQCIYLLMWRRLFVHCLLWVKGTVGIAQYVGHIETGLMPKKSRPVSCANLRAGGGKGYFPKGFHSVLTSNLKKWGRCNIFSPSSLQLNIHNNSFINVLNIF